MAEGRQPLHALASLGTVTVNQADARHWGPYFSVVLSVMFGTLARAREIGQPFLAPSACAWKPAASIPGTSPSTSRSICVIVGPASEVPRWTLAAVLMLVGVKPARPSAAPSAIEKQPACAAAISSSGLVPAPFSKRDTNEYCPSNAPLPSRMLPAPSFNEPFHSAVAPRTAIDASRMNANSE